LETWRSLAREGLTDEAVKLMVQFVAAVGPEEGKEPVPRSHKPQRAESNAPTLRAAAQ